MRCLLWLLPVAIVNGHSFRRSLQTRISGKYFSYCRRNSCLLRRTCAMLWMANFQLCPQRIFLDGRTTSNGSDRRRRWLHRYAMSALSSQSRLASTWSWKGDWAQIRDSDFAFTTVDRTSDRYWAKSSRLRSSYRFHKFSLTKTFPIKKTSHKVRGLFVFYGQRENRTLMTEVVRFWVWCVYQFRHSPFFQDLYHTTRMLHLVKYFLKLFVAIALYQFTKVW